MKPRALYFASQGFQPGSLALLREHYDVVEMDRPAPAMLDKAGDIHALFTPMGYAWDAETLSAFTNLQVVGTPTTGLMHLELEALTQMGVTVCSLHDQQPFLRTITATADLTWGLVISVTRSMMSAMDMIEGGEWNGRAIGEKCPMMLSRMSLGVIGLGRLGRIVAGYGKAFGMDVRYYDPYVEDENFERMDTPLELARHSDVVSLHVHSTPETVDMVDARFLAAMPEGSYLVNTARGDLVVEDALISALDSGHLAGAGLDMIRDDHLPGFADTWPDHPLHGYSKTHSNLVITPHYGGATRDSWEATERRVIDMMIRETQQRRIA